MFEVDTSLPVRARRGAYDAPLRRGLEPGQQQQGQRVVGQVIGGKGNGKALRRAGSSHDESAGIVDEHVDARLGCGDFRADSPLIGEHCEVCEMHGVRTTRTGPRQARQRGVRAPPIAGHQHHAGAALGQAQRRDFTDARSGARDHHGFAEQWSVL